MHSILWQCAFLMAIVATADLPFPEAFSGEYITTAHQIPETSEYPQRVKQYRVNVDRALGGSRITYEEEGEVGVTIIRNYKEHYEVRLETVDGIQTCEYSFMAESMPEPELQNMNDSIGEVTNGGISTIGYSFQDNRQYIELYYDSKSQLPVRATEFYIDDNNKPYPVFSTVYKSIVEGPQDESLFRVEE